MSQLLPDEKCTQPLVIGVSACLSGEAVRYDGGHKLHLLIRDVLSHHARLAPFCPELAAGLGVPRPPVRLITSAAGKRARGVEAAHLDVTEALMDVAEDYCRTLDERSVAAFIFKSRSPSCGWGSTAVYDEREAGIIAYGDGLFAERLRISAPWLAAVDEDWLRSELRCWRFLTATALVAEARHGVSSHAEFLREVEEQSRLAGKDLVALLLGDADVATLGALLEHYWRRP